MVGARWARSKIRAPGSRQEVKKSGGFSLTGTDWIDSDVWGLVSADEIV